ncbi:MAG: 4-phosphoerythronate dehydrogenase [Pseudomonadota bacterium]
MKLVADENILGLRAIAAAGVDVVRRPGREITNEDLLDADALWVRSVTQVDAALVHRSSLRFVGTATAGVEHIDVEALKEQGIAFASAPGANANAVVEYVLAAMLELESPWQALDAGGTLGIIGYGHVGQRLAGVAEALGWKFSVSDPHLGATPDCTLNDLGELLSCEVISLHCSLTRGTEHDSFHLFDEDQLAALGGEQTLINASRGAVVNNGALAQRLAAKDPPSVVLDVWEGEPMFDQSLLQFPALRLATSHIAGHTIDAKLNATRILWSNTRIKLPDLPDVDFESSGAGVPNELNGIRSARALMTEVYPILRDDRALRQLESADPATVGGLFDALRRDYPPRREIATLSDGKLVRLGADALRLARALRR